MKMLRKVDHHKIKTPLVGLFSTIINRRDLKLGTHMQTPNSDINTNLQRHPPFITLFTPHLCDIQCH